MASLLFQQRCFSCFFLAKSRITSSKQIVLAIYAATIEGLGLGRGTVKINIKTTRVCAFVHVKNGLICSAFGRHNGPQGLLGPGAVHRLHLSGPAVCQLDGMDQ